jgi:C4-dicarboxylate-specific signal transduction histidine kinase
LLQAAKPLCRLLNGGHDVCNLLATVGLHLDSLARLSGPHGAKAANAAHALIARAGGMCSAAIAAAESADERRRRHQFDIAATIRQVVDVVAPLGPEGFSINLTSNGTHLVLGDHTELFRVLFNLLHNALAVARAGRKLRRIDISVERTGATTAMRIADDGGGLPRQVAARPFRGPVKSGAIHGHGLAIPRELMERNGGTLSCKTSRKGTNFHLALAAITSIRVAKGPVTQLPGSAPPADCAARGGPPN